MLTTDVSLPDDALEAFDAIEATIGRDWLLARTRAGTCRSGGWGSFIDTYALGTRILAARGARNVQALFDRLRRQEPAAFSELLAIHLLWNADNEIEIEPEVAVGDGTRVPDFKVRRLGGEWTYVEVTQLGRSNASERARHVLQVIADTIVAIRAVFVLEIVLARHPTDAEIAELAALADELCRRDEPADVGHGDVARVVVRCADWRVVSPTPSSADDPPRMAIAVVLGGEDEPERQVAVRIPFEDVRAEDVLTAEARQLPKTERGLVMVDVTAQVTALTSWPAIIRRRFTHNRYTRVGCMCLMRRGLQLGPNGLVSWAAVLPIYHPHARHRTVDWIRLRFEEIRGLSQCLFGRPD
jgi:hypothetical protein